MEPSEARSYAGFSRNGPPSAREKRSLFFGEAELDSLTDNASQSISPETYDSEDEERTECVREAHKGTKKEGGFCPSVRSIRNDFRTGSKKSRNCCCAPICGAWEVVGKSANRKAVFLFVLWLFVGIYMYMWRPWGAENHYYSINEALYVMAQIITTVGYGDLVPAKPGGYLFVSFFVLCAAVTFSTLVSALTQKIADDQDKLFEETVANTKMQHPKDREMMEGSSSSDEGNSQAVDCIQHTTRIVRHRRREWRAFGMALLLWTSFVVAGMVVFSNHCEEQDCIPGRCCKMSLIFDQDLTNSSCPAMPQPNCRPWFMYDGANISGCTMLKSDRPWCATSYDFKSSDFVSEVSEAWEWCDDPRTLSEKLSRHWRFDWPIILGNSPSDVPVPQGSCVLTKATCCETKTYIQSLYMSVITLTTVGFGDMTAETHFGKWFATFWMLLGVSAFANLVGKFGGLFLARKGTLHKLDTSNLEDMLKDPFIQRCISEHDNNNGISRAEFVLYMLTTEMDVVPESLVSMLCSNFTRLDRDNSGFLDQEDLVGITLASPDASH